MSESIMDSPWMRLLEKNFEKRDDYQVDPTDDTFPELEKAVEELEAEIQAERLAKFKNRNSEKDFIKAKKYDCPLKFTVSDCESGWTHMIFDFNGIKIETYISYLGYQPSALLEATRIFHSHEISYDEGHSYSHIDIEKTEDVDSPEGIWDVVPMVVGFQWDEEPMLTTWTIIRDAKDIGKEDFPLKIRIARTTDKVVNYEFTVQYRDLCYAVAKCYTELLKQYGFSGYYHGSYGDDLNIRQLLEIKGYALGLTSNLYAEDETKSYRLQLTPDEELELLKMDM